MLKIAESYQFNKRNGKWYEMVQIYGNDVFVIFMI